MNKITKLYNKSTKININNSSKIVIMSDCHRGSGDNYDNFAKNKIIYETALLHYYRKGYTYIELGDGDELWESKNYKDIIEEHLETFKILKKFNQKKRLMMIFGNHDICKKTDKLIKKNLYTYYDKNKKKNKNLLNGLKVYETLVLNYQGYEIFLFHGHQVDFLNSSLWILSKFLVNNVWKRLEHIILNEPTVAARNYPVKNKVDKKLKKWSSKYNKMIIAGHTHRPIYPSIGQSLYFNDGSCIHPNGITCIEINKGKITLVKWSFKRRKKMVSVGRTVLEGKESITNFFKEKTQ